VTIKTVVRDIGCAVIKPFDLNRVMIKRCLFDFGEGGKPIDTLRVIETAVAMLACTRIGAIHSVIFGGFSPEAVAGRIIDCRAKVIITADEAVRGGKTIPLKVNVDEALTHPDIRSLETASGENPPKMTEWIAPMRVQASIATAVSMTIGM
jgi:acyl-coenzyme A synthetase/AMP-(fatty) acid ligase